jgi:hypothetical protein
MGSGSNAQPNADQEAGAGGGLTTKQLSEPKKDKGNSEVSSAGCRTPAGCSTRCHAQVRPRN